MKTGNPRIVFAVSSAAVFLASGDATIAVAALPAQFLIGVAVFTLVSAAAGWRRGRAV